MGLDWCLEDKPRPGREVEFAVLHTQQEELTEAQRELLGEVSIGPAETLGYPTVDVSDETKAWYIEHVIRPHQERIAEEVKKEPAKVGAGPLDDPGRNDAYIEHWSHSDEHLLERDAKRRLVDDAFVEYTISTVQAFGPFLALAGLHSFRGKVIGYSPMLTEELKEEAYHDMSPQKMADYAARIEECALAGFNFARASSLTPATARDMVDNWDFPSNWDDRTSADGEVDQLATVLDAARWLRFWADLGHPMHAWY